MRIMVTGGAGFIGSHVADALLADNHEVLVVDNLSTGRRDNVHADADFAQIDIRNADALNKVFSEFRPEAISHQAAQTSVAVSTREAIYDGDVNVIGGLRVLEAAVKNEVEHLVFASTGGAIYGEVPEGTRAGVDTPPNPLSPYACSKLAFEHYLGAYAHEVGFRSTVLRYANVYGPRQDPHGEAGVVAIFSQRVLAGEGIRINARKEAGDKGCVRDYVYVQDAVKANLAALQGKLETRVLNVATGEATTTDGLAEQIMRAANKEVERAFTPRRAGDLERSVLDASEFTRQIAPPASLERGIQETVAWFQTRKG